MNTITPQPLNFKINIENSVYVKQYCSTMFQFMILDLMDVKIFWNNNYGKVMIEKKSNEDRLIKLLFYAQN